MVNAKCVGLREWYQQLQLQLHTTLVCVFSVKNRSRNDEDGAHNLGNLSHYSVCTVPFMRGESESAHPLPIQSKVWSLHIEERVG